MNYKSPSIPVGNFRDLVAQEDKVAGILSLGSDSLQPHLWEENSHHCSMLDITERLGTQEKLSGGYMFLSMD